MLTALNEWIVKSFPGQLVLRSSLQKSGFVAFKECRGRSSFCLIDLVGCVFCVLGDWISGHVVVKAGEDTLVGTFLLHKVVREVGARSSLARSQRFSHIIRTIFILFFQAFWHDLSHQGTRSVEDRSQLLLLRQREFIFVAVLWLSFTIFADTVVYLPTGIPVGGFWAGREGEVFDLHRRVHQLVGGRVYLHDQVALYGSLVNNELPGDDLEPLEILLLGVVVENQAEAIIRRSVGLQLAHKGSSPSAFPCPLVVSSRHFRLVGGLQLLASPVPQACSPRCPCGL